MFDRRFILAATIYGMIGWAVVGFIIGVLNSAYSFDLFDCSKHALVLNTVSRHIDPGRKYNEEHWGLSYECRRHDPRWGWQGGYYRNSFDRDTWYGVVAYQPWALFGVRFGGFAGAGTGYREHEKENVPDEPRGGLSPLAGAIVSWEGKDKGLNLIVGTSVVFLQLKALW